ncbi:hypothetical protein [Rhizorhabdus sp.]|uniref:hypothetical protein n=1 Tax=Rhizorhabdus sp. TaxID=1968843 RepID=UPI001B5B5062|nr:hypothetical protein [Rhizorhabdus sp.]MBP8235899.1 hypothetical protein [Rhizorhabdus sp.]
MTAKDLPRLALSAVIIAYFGWAMVYHWSDGLEETLKNLAVMAVGYWLGSSKGSSDNGARMEKLIELARRDGQQGDGR